MLCGHHRRILLCILQIGEWLIARIFELFDRRDGLSKDLVRLLIEYVNDLLRCTEFRKNKPLFLQILVIILFDLPACSPYHDMANELITNDLGVRSALCKEVWASLFQAL